MIWEDILTEESRPQRELRDAFAMAFGVAVRDVAVVRDMEQESDALVTCHVQQLGGQFPLMASVYLRPGVVAGDRLAAFRALSDHLKTRLLVAADGSDPYVMLLVDRDRVSQVNLNVAALDEREEYVLA